MHQHQETWHHNKYNVTQANFKLYNALHVCKSLYWDWKSSKFTTYFCFKVYYKLKKTDDVYWTHEEHIILALNSQQMFTNSTIFCNEYLWRFVCYCKFFLDETGVKWNTSIFVTKQYDSKWLSVHFLHLNSTS